MSPSLEEGILKKAVKQADLYEISHLPSDHEIDHEFSDEFQRKMKKLIRQSKSKSSSGIMVFIRRRAVAIVAAILILIGCAMSISPVRAAIIEFINWVYEEFTYIFFNQESPSSQDLTDEFIVYEPTYIPEGFILKHKYIGDFSLMEYENGKDYIIYNQQGVEDVSTGFNTEGVQIEELVFKGMPARYYSNEGIQSLIWYDEHYIYSVSSSLERDVVFEIANSVKNKDIDSEF